MVIDEPFPPQEHATSNTNTDALHRRIIRHIEYDTLMNTVVLHRTSTSPLRTDDGAVTVSSEVVERTPRLWKHLTNEMSKETTIAFIGLSGLVSVANRLSDLNKLAKMDSVEPAMDAESLHRFALFMFDRQMPIPKIGLTPNGLIQAAWFTRDGILSMDFLPSGKVRYTAVLRDGEWSVCGTSLPSRMMAEIEPFKREL